MGAPCGLPVTVAGCLCPSVCLPDASITGSCGCPPVAAQDSDGITQEQASAPERSPHTGPRTGGSAAVVAAEGT